MIRGFASPVAAEEGVAAARRGCCRHLSLRWRPPPSLRRAGRTHGRPWDENVCFPVGREESVLKWYVQQTLFLSLISA